MSYWFEAMAGIGAVVYVLLASWLGYPRWRVLVLMQYGFLLGAVFLLGGGRLLSRWSREGAISEELVHVVLAISEPGVWLLVVRYVLASGLVMGLLVALCHRATRWRWPKGEDFWKGVFLASTLGFPYAWWVAALDDGVKRLHPCDLGFHVLPYPEDVFPGGTALVAVSIAPGLVHGLTILGVLGWYSWVGLRGREA